MTCAQRLTVMLLGCCFGMYGCNTRAGLDPIAEQVAGPTDVAVADDAADRPIQVKHDGYIGSRSCRECHQEQHASWQASYHRTMTQTVSNATVQGSFDGQTRNFYGWSFQPESRGDEFWMSFQSQRQSETFDYRLVLATGSHHMQKYWYYTGSSRKLGLAPIIYLKESRRWVPEHTAFLRRTEDGLPFREGAWNTGCSQCHATGTLPRVFGPNAMDTHVAEFGISCEACHGPGERHVQLGTADSICNPRRLSSKLSAQVCGQCHGAWLARKGAGERDELRGSPFRPGDDLFQYRYYVHAPDDVELHAKIKAEDSFWPDGHVRVAGREYNALLASPCYLRSPSDERRMSCISCHDLHNAGKQNVSNWVDDQLGKGMDSNEACLQCHESMRKQLEVHTHHDADSAGSQCYNCHMPYSSYGLLKAVRAHTITSPSVEQTLSTGRPNACNQCHLDRTLDWTATHLISWYEQAPVALPPEHRQVAASIIWAVRGDAAQRALMAWSMGWSSAHQATDPHWMVFYLTNLMFDDYDAIRYIAHRSLRSVPGYAEIEYDHLAPETEKESVMQTILSIWHARNLQVPSDGTLLYTSDGTIRMDVFRALLQQRDDRDMVITE